MISVYYFGPTWFHIEDILALLRGNGIQIGAMDGIGKGGGGKGNLTVVLAKVI
jgi:hypothetical protein